MVCELRNTCKKKHEQQTIESQNLPMLSDSKRLEAKQRMPRTLACAASDTAKNEGVCLGFHWIEKPTTRKPECVGSPSLRHPQIGFQGRETSRLLTTAPSAIPWEENVPFTRLQPTPASDGAQLNLFFCYKTWSVTLQPPIFPQPPLGHNANRSRPVCVCVFQN